MPSKNMLPKGKRRQSVKKDYRVARSIAQDQAAAERARIDENFGEKEVVEDPLIATASFMEAEPTLEERIATNNWFTTKGASGSKVAEETHDPRRYDNPYARIHEPAAPVIAPNPALAAPAADGTRTFTAEPAAANMRLDAYLARAVPDVSRSRVQTLIDGGQVLIDGTKARASQKLRGGETIRIEGEAQPAPIRATPEDIPLTVIYEDADLAVIDKPAGMMVHAGSGSSTHNTGTLVNALLHRFGTNLSSGAAPVADDDGDLEAAGALEATTNEVTTPEPWALNPGPSPQPRPGIVHRLDKDTSGLIVVAKNDLTHRKLGELFAGRKLRKTYLALVHGHIADDTGTITLPIARDVQRRIRMTTRRPGGRHAISHWRVLERLDTPWGKFTLVEVRIETGRTHQIRVHMQAIGHSVVGDNLYGAPKVIRPPAAKPSPGARPRKRKQPDDVQTTTLSLDRNFLHAAELEFAHPRTGKTLSLRAELPPELESFLDRLKGA